MKNAFVCNVISVQRTDADVLNARLKNLNWWIYPNATDEKFSKIQARVNFAGYLVVGQDMQTRIVCIEDGVLTLSDNGCASAVRYDDPRLFVFLPTSSP